MCEEKRKKAIALETINLSEEDTHAVNEVLTYQTALDRLFTRLTKESTDAVMKTQAMWRRLEGIAKEQFPWFDTDEHFLSFNHITLKVNIYHFDDRNLLNSR